MDLRISGKGRNCHPQAELKRGFHTHNKGGRQYPVLAFVLPMLLLAPLALETLRVERQELPLRCIEALPLRPSPPPRLVPLHAVPPACTVA
jgi:hypothetical protein